MFKEYSKKLKVTNSQTILIAADEESLKKKWHIHP